MNDDFDAKAAAAAPMEVPAHVQAGLPEVFTLDELNAHLTPEEVHALTATDSVTELPDADAPPADQAAQPQPDQAQTETQPHPQNEPDFKLPSAPDTSAAEQQIAALKAEAAALLAKYDDGDLTQAELLAEQERINAAQADAMAQKALAMNSYQAQVQSVAKVWGDRVGKYQAANPILETEEHWAGWDAALKSINSEPAYNHLSIDQRITLAHRFYAMNYEALTGKPLPGSAPASAEADTGSKGGPRTDPRPEPPQTLANISATPTNPGIDEGAFAAIDSLISQGRYEQAELAIARMPPDQREAFEAMMGA